MTEYNTQAKTRLPKGISSVISLGPPDPTTIGARVYALPEPTLTPHIIFKPRQIAPEPTYLSKLQCNDLNLAKANKGHVTSNHLEHH
ncbi:hypothetical protein [Absidia glauca]|uniref:Uncharacterized protein n=1 Tax=Absidia glauca TaxID=4829 RepID=A0A163JW51_ABSGL|nr:hypothetical protein [Absidia glauca]